MFQCKKLSNLSGGAPGQIRAKPISLHPFKVVFKIFCSLHQQSEDQMKKNVPNLVNVLKIAYMYNKGG